jgi:LPXTG-motif cell wall-anchored protein
MGAFSPPCLIRLRIYFGTQTSLAKTKNKNQMSKKLSFLNKAFLSFLSFTLLISAILSFYSINTFAQRIGIKPFNEPNTEARGVFRYVVNPGETINDAIVITNQSDFVGTASVLAKDSTTDTGGALTFIPSDQTNTGPGQWIELVQDSVEVPAEKAVKVPFTIRVPNDVKSGEYAAGIVASATSNQEAQGNTSVQVRMGTTIYITVRGDLNLDNETTEFSVINPGQEFFPEELDARGFINPDNMVIKFRGINKGNIYSTIEGKIILTLPDGETKEIPVKRTLNLDSSFEYFYVNTSLPYQIGKTKAIFEFESKPYNFNSGENGVNAVGGRSEYEFDLTAEGLERFKNSRDQVDSQRKADFDESGKPKAFEVEQNATQVLPQTGGEQNQLIYIIAGFLILLLLAIILFLLLKKKKDEDEKTKNKA